MFDMQTVLHYTKCAGFFWSETEFFLNDRKKLSQFGHNVRKYRVANTVTASFNSKYGTNDRNVSAKKNSKSFLRMFKALIIKIKANTKQARVSMQTFR